MALWSRSRKGEYNLNINVQSGFYSNALQAVSAEGHKKIVELLLDKSTDINTQGREYGNALQAVSDKGYENIIELLLDKGTNINTQGGFFGTI